MELTNEGYAAWAREHAPDKGSETMPLELSERVLAYCTMICPLCKRSAVDHGISVTATETGLQMAAVCPSTEIKYLDARTMREDGYLQEANRGFFHPLGLALELRRDGDQLAILRVWDYRDDPEGIRFDGDEIDLMLKAQRLAEIAAIRRRAVDEKVRSIMDDERSSGPGVSRDREGDSDQYSWKRDTEARRQAEASAGLGITPGPVLVEVHKTSSLRLSEVEACSFCEEFVGSEFHVLDLRFGVVRELLDETSLKCEGFPEAVARALAAQPDAGVVIGEDPEFTTRLYICRTCFNRSVDLPLAAARTIARRALVASRHSWNRHIPMNRAGYAGLVPDPVWKVGEYVRFAHIPAGGPAYRVEAIGAGGMIEIEGMTGEFAPSIFVPAEKIPEREGLPSAADLDAHAAEQKTADETK